VFIILNGVLHNFFFRLFFLYNFKTKQLKLKKHFNFFFFNREKIKKEEYSKLFEKEN